MVYEVEVKKGTHKEKKTPNPLAKWEATVNSPYKSLPIPQRYLLQHHLSAPMGEVWRKPSCGMCMTIFGRAAMFMPGGKGAGKRQSFAKIRSVFFSCSSSLKNKNM